MKRHYDALICGGGLAGLTLARQLKREIPNLAVAVVEKTRRPLPDAAHKVGESTVELGAQYLERLGLRSYLQERHLPKFGLRFFPGGGHLPIEKRTEIGPINQPVVASYQIDRGRFESDLREMIEVDGVDLFEGAVVRDVHLRTGGEAHVVTVDANSASHVLGARWVVDATGRTGFLRGRLKLKRGAQHDANAAWFRVAARIDLNQMAASAAERWHRVPDAEKRWLSTNHLMGTGYWVWVIPLATGNTSIGIVTHDHVHGFDEVRTLERALAFLEKHEPVFARFLKSAEVLDFRCLRNYAHTVSRCWHTDRWGLVGEAGAFSDPLYSPGTDYIALANAFTTELIRVDLERGDLERRVRELNVQYRALVAGSIGVYRRSAEVYGHARAMATKVFWDNHVYWSFPCQFFLQDIYKLSGDDLAPFTEVGARFVELSGRMQEVLRFWAIHEPATSRDLPPDGEMLVVPAFPSMLVDAHCALARKMSPAETLAYMRRQLELAERLFVEILSRVLRELGRDKAQALWSDLGADAWEVRFCPERVAAESLEGRARRRALPELARDVERALGVARERWSLSDVVASFESPASAAGAA